jgi:hypothetical protein
VHCGPVPVDARRCRRQIAARRRSPVPITTMPARGCRPSCNSVRSTLVTDLGCSRLPALGSLSIICRSVRAASFPRPACSPMPVRSHTSGWRKSVRVAVLDGAPADLSYAGANRCALPCSIITRSLGNSLAAPSSTDANRCASPCSVTTTVGQRSWGFILLWCKSVRGTSVDHADCWTPPPHLYCRQVQIGAHRVVGSRRRLGRDPAAGPRELQIVARREWIRAVSRPIAVFDN